MVGYLGIGFDCVFSHVDHTYWATLIMLLNTALARH